MFTRKLLKLKWTHESLPTAWGLKNYWKFRKLLKTIENFLSELVDSLRVADSFRLPFSLIFLTTRGEISSEFKNFSCSILNFKICLLHNNYKKESEENFSVKWYLLSVAFLSVPDQIVLNWNQNLLLATLNWNKGLSSPG